MKKIFRRQNSTPFLRQVSFDLVLDVSAGIFQRALVDESGMIPEDSHLYKAELLRVKAVATCSYHWDSKGLS
jgi:hypothetical protein